MSVSDDIRSLARAGMSVADISRQLGIRYQHAYNVLKASGGPSTGQVAGVRTTRLLSRKPPLSVAALVNAGFECFARWILGETGHIEMDGQVPKTIGVYAFAKDDTVQYVGVATDGLAKRLYLYAKPGPSQGTNQRLNKTIKDELSAGHSIEIFTASPVDCEWNGLPVDGSTGLEFGLIRKFDLPWNVRGSGSVAA